MDEVVIMDLEFDGLAVGMMVTIIIIVYIVCYTLYQIAQLV